MRPLVGGRRHQPRLADNEVAAEHIVTVEHHGVALGVLVAVENGVDMALVHTVGQHLHRSVGELVAGMVFIPAADFHGLLAGGDAKFCGLQRIGEHGVDIELAEEEVARGDGLAKGFSESTGRLGVEAHALALVAIGCRVGGELLGGPVAVQDGHAGIARGPVVVARAVLDLVEGMVGASAGEGVHGHMLEAEEVGNRGADFLEVDAVGACPRAVLRRHRVGHGTLRKVLQRAVGGLDGGTGGEREIHGDERQASLGAHLEDYLRAVRWDIVNSHL